jgi:hypothetical protein
MSFVHKIALLMTVRSLSFMRALQVFLGICFTRFVEFSLNQWHVFYITVLKIIYVHNDDIHNTYETYIRVGFSAERVPYKSLLKEGKFKKQKKKRK